MTSLRSKLIISLIRNRHLLKGKLKPEVVDATFNVQAFRDGVDKLSERMNKIPPHITVTSDSIGGMYGEWIKPDGAPPNKVVLYIHGGGFISGSCLTHRMHVVKFATNSRLVMYLFDYRLAPEHPFPAAVEDCLAVYRGLLARGYTAEQIVIMGESAGGTLTLSTLVAAQDEGLPQPAGAVSISPVTDLTCEAPSFITNAHRDIAPFGSWTTWTQMYIADNDVHHPWLSPLMADVTAIAPVMIQIGTHEIHFDDAVNFATKAKESGVSVTLRVWEKMIHAFPILSPLFPEAKQAMNEICQCLRKQLQEENR